MEKSQVHQAWIFDSRFRTNIEDPPSTTNFKFPDIHHISRFGVKCIYIDPSVLALVPLGSNFIMIRCSWNRYLKKSNMYNGYTGADILELVPLTPYHEFQDISYYHMDFLTMERGIISDIDIDLCDSFGNSLPLSSANPNHKWTIVMNTNIF